MNLLLFLPLAVLIWPQAWSLPEFKTRIPNGNNVRHPCMDGVQWQSVGHQNYNNGPELNPFGRDFSIVGNKAWTRTLCEHDSDGDGRTNGEELGDPHCEWTPGQDPFTTEGITHPGVCEPIDSPMCQEANQFLKCEQEVFDCDVMNEADVEHIDIRLPVTKVPGVETTYICMTFDLPSDQDYHVVAFTPIIDNVNVVHHMIIYGCPIHSEVYMETPGSCEMPASGDSCFEMLTAWTVGVSGRCYGRDLGFRVGQSATRRVRLEIHWNNPMLEQDYTDSSGMRIYYKPARQGVQDLAVLTTGQTFLEIPPGQSQVDFNGTCPGYCTSSLITQPVYVLDVLNHMHYLGKSMKVQVYRHGQMLKELSNDRTFDYDNPVFHEHRPPFQLLPGDEIKTFCSFQSMRSKRWVYYGDGTSDEMCYAFLLLYPKQGIPYTGWCTSQGPLSTCDWSTYKWIGDCNWAQYVDPSNHNNVERWLDLENNCNLNGFCRPECRALVKKLKEHPCLQGEAAKIVRYLMAMSHPGALFLTRLNSCSDGSHPDGLAPGPHTPQTPPPRPRPPVDCDQQCAQICTDNDRNEASVGSVGGGAEGRYVRRYGGMASLLLVFLVTSGVFVVRGF